MARFNFTAINLNSAANITEVMNNFNKIEELGITEEEVNNKITSVNNSISSLDKSLGGLSKRNYSVGTAAPSGGSNGDIYDQYFN